MLVTCVVVVLVSVPVRGSTVVCVVSVVTVTETVLVWVAVVVTVMGARSVTVAPTTEETSELGSVCGWVDECQLLWLLG